MPGVEELTHIVFAFGPGGWVKTFWRRSGAEESAWIRFEPVTRARKTPWRIVELRVLNPTAERLREIPLHRAELAFNALEMSETLRDQLKRPVPADLDSAIYELYRAEPRKQLQRPATRKLDDEFFRAVAFAYRDAVIRQLNPGKTIAADADVPPTTAARWIAQARERGYLPPATQGKVSV
jgi:hypothetical protein